MHGQDKREYDGNGWFEVKANPISKVGIFPYSGRQLGLTGADADRIFQVLRPEEELSAPECIESFKLVPWVDDHAMLGPAAQEVTDQAMAAEKKGIHGVIGEDVYYQDGVLYANIKAFSNTLAALIQAGKRELSAGYRCIYDIASGVWNGQHYDAVQRQIRGNHLALVQEGRMGPDVAVMDSFTFSFDTKELENMAQENAGSAISGMTLEQLVAVVNELAPQVAKLTEAMGTMMGAAEKAEHQATGAIQDEQPAVTDGEQKPEAPAADMEEKKDEDQYKSGMDAAMIERNIVQRLAKRDSIARQLSVHIGTFDHAEKSLEQVVAYGLDKLGVKAEKGQEMATLAGYLQAKKAEAPAATVTGMDSAKPAAGSFIDQFLGA
jgi:hypothetical protein